MKIKVIVLGGAEAVQVHRSTGVPIHDIHAYFKNWDLLAVPDAPEIDEDEPDWNNVDDDVEQGMSYDNLALVVEVNHKVQELLDAQEAQQVALNEVLDTLQKYADSLLKMAEGRYER